MEKLKKLFNDYIAIERHNAFKMGYEQGQKVKPTAQWVVGDQEKGLYKCSNCGLEQPFIRSKEKDMIFPVFPLYCYNCGCQMELSTEANESVNQFVNQSVNEFNQEKENDVVNVKDDQDTDKE